MPLPETISDYLRAHAQELGDRILQSHPPLREHRGNQSVISVALNALLAYPDRPFGFGDLIGREFNPETQRREPFLIAATRDLDEDFVYAKERRLVEEVKASLDRERKVQVYALYTQKRDVTRRLQRILAKEGIRVAVLTTEVAPEQRESCYERQLRVGVQVVIAHPRLVRTGLDLWSFPDIFFYETGYSIYTSRQASRRSWRIGQWSNVNVKFFYYAGTMQEACLRLMGKKLLVSLAMEGKFATDGLQAIDEGDDILMAMAKELVTEKRAIARGMCEASVTRMNGCFPTTDETSSASLSVSLDCSSRTKSRRSTPSSWATWAMT